MSGRRRRGTVFDQAERRALRILARRDTSSARQYVRSRRGAARLPDHRDRRLENRNAKVEQPVDACRARRARRGSVTMPGELLGGNLGPPPNGVSSRSCCASQMAVGSVAGYRVQQAPRLKMHHDELAMARPFATWDDVSSAPFLGDAQMIAR